ncbi:MAG: GIY-YIG nuclease family protein [Acutalibacteraceae bacterium]
MNYYTYLLECADGTFYCGYTGDLAHRVAVHNEGRGAKYTRSRRPVRLVYYETFASKGEAMSREWHIKHDLTRAEKAALAAGFQAENHGLPPLRRNSVGEQPVRSRNTAEK